MQTGSSSPLGLPSGPSSLQLLGYGQMKLLSQLYDELAPAPFLEQPKPLRLRWMSRKVQGCRCQLGIPLTEPFHLQAAKQPHGGCRLDSGPKLNPLVLVIWMVYSVH